MPTISLDIEICLTLTWMRRRVICLLKRAHKAWQRRIEVLHSCEEMGMLRSRRMLRERTAVCFALWSQGAAEQHLAERKVVPAHGLLHTSHLLWGCDASTLALCPCTYCAYVGLHGHKVILL